MKKTAALVCALLLVLLLPGCTLVQQVGNVTKQAEELPVAECVQAAADGDEDTFRSYLHPALSVEAVQGGYQSLHQYLNGTKVLSTQVQTCNINSSVGTSGSNKTISARILVTLEQGTVLMDVIYQENTQGSGFSQFLCSMGIAQ